MGDFCRAVHTRICGGGGNRTYTDEDGDEHEYECYILNINLTTKPLGDILSPRMDAAQREIFDTLMDSKGNLQYTISPLGFDWLPNITCHYGWRVHPISGERDFHNAVDIGIPEGTPILADTTVAWSPRPTTRTGTAGM